jgi:hypothetical protein
LEVKEEEDLDNDDDIEGKGGFPALYDPSHILGRPELRLFCSIIYVRCG